MSGASRLPMEIIGKVSFAWRDLIVGIPDEEYDGDIWIVAKTTVHGKVTETQFPLSVDAAEDLILLLETALGGR